MGLGPGSGSIFQPQFNVICAQAATEVIPVPCTPAEQELDCGHQLIPRELGKGRCGEAAATHPEKLEPLCPAQRRKDWGEFPATQPSEKRNNHLPQQPAPGLVFFSPTTFFQRPNFGEVQRGCGEQTLMNPYLRSGFVYQGKFTQTIPPPELILQINFPKDKPLKSK